MSLTLFEGELVQSIQSVVAETTLARELIAEEALTSPDIFSDNADGIFALRILLLSGLIPGVTAADLARRMGKGKRRTIERHLAAFREVGLLVAFTKVRKGQWTKPHTRYSKGGPVPMQHWLMGDMTNPLFQNLDSETRKSLWRVRKFLVKTPGFREYLRRSLAATSKMIQAGGIQLQQMMDRVPELKLLSRDTRTPTSYPRLWLGDEIAAYTTSRLLFAMPEEEKEALPRGEYRRLSFVS